MSTLGAGWAERQGWQSRSLLGAVMVGLAFYMWLLPLILQALPTSASWLVPALALLGGSLVGGAFPLAVKLSTGEAGHRAGLIYGADLIGGCLGALLTAVLWVPLLGLPTTCLVVGLWVVAGAVSLL